jgi:hypothetical protein
MGSCHPVHPKKRNPPEVCTLEEGGFFKIRELNILFFKCA